VSFFSKIMEILRYRARKNALTQLQQMSNRQLKDCGISRALLDEGTRAWPWRETAESLAPLRFDPDSDTEVNRSDIDENLERAKDVTVQPSKAA